MTKKGSNNKLSEKEIIGMLDDQRITLIGEALINDDKVATIVNPKLFYNQIIKVDSHRFDNCTDEETVLSRAMNNIPNITRDNCSSYGISISKQINKGSWSGFIADHEPLFYLMSTLSPAQIVE